MAVDRTTFSSKDVLWLFALGVFWLIVSLNHELGHDEAQAWNIARDSQAWWDVVWNSRFEGHTPVWFALLWPIALTGHPVFMQMLAICLGLSIAYLLLRYRSIPLWLCLLVLCGYFIGYEYTILPRPYIVATLLCVWLAVLLSQRKAGFIKRSLICSLVASTSAFGVVLSVPLMLLVLVEELISRDRPSGSARVWLSGLGMYGVTALTAVYLVVWPIEDRVFESSVLSGDRMSMVTWWQTIRSAVFPHVDRLPMGVGEAMGPSGALGILVIACSLVVSLCVAIWVADRPAALLSWIVAVLLLSAAVIVSGTGAERHMGHLFLAALVLVWARPGLSTIDWRSRLNVERLAWPVSSMRSAHRFAAGVLVLAVLYQAFLGLGAAGLDVARGLTQWPTIAQRVRQESQGDTVVMTDHIYQSGALAALLDEPLFDMRCQCWTRHELWQGSRIPESLPDYRQLLIAQSCKLQSEHDQVLFVRAMRHWPEDAPFIHVAEFGVGYRDGRYSNPQLYRFDTGRGLCSDERSREPS